MKDLYSYVTYILKCSDGTFYTGKTTNIEKRLRQHNGIISGGAKYTRGRRPVQLVYMEKFENNQLACQREEHLRNLTHDQKTFLCNEFSLQYA